MIKRYDIIAAQAGDEYVTVRRQQDGKTARVKASWIKRAGDAHVPASRTKAIRLDGNVEWEKAGGKSV